MPAERCMTAISTRQGTYSRRDIAVLRKEIPRFNEGLMSMSPLVFVMKDAPTNGLNHSNDCGVQLVLYLLNVISSPLQALASEVSVLPVSSLSRIA